MKKIITILLIILLAFGTNAIASTFDKSMIPPEISEEELNLSCTGKDCSWVLAGLRFDLDDEGFPVVIVKTRQTNLSERGVPTSGQLWIFSYNPLTQTSGGSALDSGGSHYKEYLGSASSKNKEFKKVSKVWELKGGETIEFEYPYKIENFSDPIYMYFPTEENSKNKKWLDETIVVIPEDSSVNPLKKKP